MKLATLKDETRDGTLIVVSRDLKHAIKADDMTFTNCYCSMLKVDLTRMLILRSIDMPNFT